MSSDGFKYQFSKYLVKSAISAMKNTEDLPSKEAKYKLVDLYYMICESMSVAIEEYIAIEDRASRDSYINKLEAKVESLEDDEIQKKLEEIDGRFTYQGKETPEA